MTTVPPTVVNITKPLPQKLCPKCGASYAQVSRYCEADGSVLIDVGESDAPTIRTFGTRYQIVREIGRGGMGEVFLAIQIRLGRLVALKLLGQHLAGSSEDVDRFVREGTNAARVKHPNVAIVYDA